MEDDRPDFQKCLSGSHICSNRKKKTQQRYNYLRKFTARELYKLIVDPGVIMEKYQEHDSLKLVPQSKIVKNSHLCPEE